MTTTVQSDFDRMMKLYYENVFPFDLIAEWLVYGCGESETKKEEPKEEEEDDAVMVDSLPAAGTTPSSSSSSSEPFFKYREFACMFKRGDKEKVLRYRSFKNGQEMRAEFAKSVPARIEIGPVYNKPITPSNRGILVATERELIFGKSCHYLSLVSFFFVVTFSFCYCHAQILI